MIFAVGVFCAAPAKSVSAADEAAGKNEIEHAFYDFGSYCWEEYYVSLSQQSVDIIENIKKPNNEYYSVADLWAELDNFFAEYEKLMYNPGTAADPDTGKDVEVKWKKEQVMRTDTAGGDPYADPYAYLGYVVYPTPQAFRDYHGYTKTEEGIHGTMDSGFFAAKYPGDNLKIFYGADYFDRAGAYSFEQIKGAKRSLPVMTAFLLYGRDAFGTPADEEDRAKYDEWKFTGLSNSMPGLFSGTDTMASLFSDFDLYETYATHSRYSITNAELKETDRLNGVYYHIWQVSYTDGRYDPGRPMTYAYVRLRADGFYITGFIITVAFVGIMLLVTAPWKKASGTDK